MRPEIKTKMEKQIDDLTSRYSEAHEKNISQLDSDIKDIKADAQAESDAIDREEGAKAIYEIYQSFVKTGFSDKQAFELTKIALTNATKRTLF